MRSSHRKPALFAAFCATAIFLPLVTLAATGVTHTTRGSSTAARLRPDVRRFSERVNAALANRQAQRIFWGVEVADRDTGQIIYDFNADRFFMPASNAKLFATSLALATLGGGYQYRTTLESAARITPDGKLAGDLVFVGRGDPDLSNVVFPYQLKTQRNGPVEKILGEMVDGVVAKGLKEVDGDVVADDSYFPYDPYPLLIISHTTASSTSVPVPPRHVTYPLPRRISSNKRSCHDSTEISSSIH